jgi:PKD repeat protein
MFRKKTPVRSKRRHLRLELLESRDLLNTTPLNDLGPGLYQGFPGGLYPGGQDTRPAAFETAGENIARQIVPLDAAGNVNLSQGRIVMVSIGMSNATDEFGSGGPGSFMPRADADPSKNPQLTIVDCAQAGAAAPAWADPNELVWTVANQRLAAAGVTPEQVEVAWVKEAEKVPANLGPFPTSAQVLEQDLATISRNLLIHFPHIRIAYLSSRTHAYTTDPMALNPEPYAYESGFSVQWLIASQINGTGNLNYDPSQGPVVAPYLSWGPYLWADGTSPRSDGFTWWPTDVVYDHIHPSASGVAKVADQLLAFFKTDPTTTPWFLRTTAAGQAPTLSVSDFTTEPGAPFGVYFSASASDPNASIIQYAWTFDDGDYSLAQNPAIIFYVPGTYQIHLTVTDSLGNTALSVVTITVPAQTPDHLFISHLYQDILGRAVDARGLGGWGRQLDQGVMTRTQVAQALVDSGEYRGDEVQRFYQQVLLRPPNATELANGISALGQGTTAEQLEAGLFGSDEYFIKNGDANAGFLMAVYPAILNRPPSAAELQSGEQALANGTSRTTLAAQVLATVESDTLEAQALYEQFFHQLPDAVTQASLVGELQEGTPNEQVAVELAGSDAYVQTAGGNANELYVERLYRDLLQRNADVGGLSGWTSQLDSGAMSRQEVVQAFLSSAEYRRVQVQDQYQSLLHRPVDPTGLVSFSNYLAQGNSVENMDALLAGSDEYFQNRGGSTNDGFLSALYQDVLGRPIDPTGLANWEQALAGGMSRSAVAASLYSSLEYDQHLVGALFQRYLGRSPTTAELTTQVGALQSGAHDETVIAMLVASTEYFLLP